MLRDKNKGFEPYVASVKLVLACTIFTLGAPAAASASPTAALSDNDVKRAEKIIAKLRRLEEVTASSMDFRTYRAEIKRLYPELFVDASELREGGLKTDLTTAVFLYEEVYRDWGALAARETDCDREVRAAYLKLCREIQDGSPTRLLWSKARLHAKWAQAVVRSYRGANDLGTLTELSEIEAERKVDLILAERALVALRKLDGKVPDTFDAAEGGERIPYDQLSGEVSEVLSTVGQLLSSLPRSPLYLMLNNARSSYRDGLFWWGKTYRRRGLTVSVNQLAAPDPLEVIGLPADRVNDAVRANWRSALKYIDQAEKALGALKS